MAADNIDLVFGQPLIGEAEIREVEDTLRSGWIGCGPKTKQFEADFARYKSTHDALAMNSGTSALFHALDAAGIGPGDEVITTALTFVATINAIIHVGATPVIVDVDETTQNIDPVKIAEAITPKTKAILPVHLAGLPCDMDAIMKIAKAHGLQVIEDAAHAIEAEYKGQKIGAIGDFGCFSFYPTKNLTTGEGGMLLAKNPVDLDRARSRSAHGLSSDAYKRYTSSTFAHYRATDVGYKNNMSDLQAALGIHQLARLEENWLIRQQYWMRYREELSGLGLVLPCLPDTGVRHAYHLFVLRVTPEFGETRDNFIKKMNGKGIGCGVHFLSIADHPYHEDRLGLNAEDYPIANQISEQTVSIPLSAKLTDFDVERVVAAVKDISRGNPKAK